MKNKSSIIYIISIISTFIVLFSSCKDKESDIGLGMLPNSDKFEMKADTFDVNCYTIPRKRALSIYEHTLSPLGSYNDPIFGYTKAGFIAQIRPEAVNPDFSNKEIKSIELEFKVANIYGEKETAQKINIHRLLKDFDPKDDYYNDLKLESADYELIASSDLKVTEDSIIRVELPLSLANSLTSKENSKYYTQDTTFFKFFKGLYITTDDISSNGAIFSINLLSRATKMLIKFNNEADNFEYTIKKRNVRINLFQHDYTNASPDLKAVIEDTLTANKKCYIQNLGGLETKLLFPKDKIDALKNKNVVINKATLIGTIEPSEKDNIYTPPKNFLINKRLKNGENERIKDFNNFSKEQNANLGKVENNTFSFEIPLQIQDLISYNETDYGLSLYGHKYKVIPYRAVLNGNSGNEKRMKLIVFYTEVK